MNREQKRKRIKSVKIMGKRLTRSQRKYVYKESVRREKEQKGEEKEGD